MTGVNSVAAISNILKESTRKTETSKPTQLLLKPRPSKFQINTHNGPKLPSSNLDTGIPPVGLIAQAKQQSLIIVPRPLIHQHDTSQTAALTPGSATSAPNPTVACPYSPQRGFQPTEQSCKLHPTESPPRPPILSQPRSLFYTGNLPVPIHAKNVLEQPNPWVDEQHCRSASSTNTIMGSTELKHAKIHDGCKVGNFQAGGSVQDKVGQLDKGLPKGLPRGAMFIQLPKSVKMTVAEQEVIGCAETCAAAISSTAVASELTPLLALKSAPVPATDSPWKEGKDNAKGNKRQELWKERRRAASSSQTISEPATGLPQPVNLDQIVPSTSPVKIKTKESVKEQRKRDKEERKAESLRKKSDNLKKKSEKKLKRHGLGAIAGAGSEHGVFPSFFVYSPCSLGLS